MQLCEKSTVQTGTKLSTHKDVTDTRYSETLRFLNTINLAFNNRQVKKPSKERMHYVIDVIHEVTDRQAVCSEERRANARIALTLNAMIDMFAL